MNMEQYELMVVGMSCTSCVENISNVVRRVEDVHRVDTNHETEEVKITTDEGTEGDGRQTVHDAGFDIPA